ncbi:MAG: hypothetical protein HY822_07880 [Acidobacteria bacterium]|nr:hypothetical protein [Acidobacteriota bacterium]
MPRYPRRVRAGLAPDTLVDAVDVMPTLLSLAGIAPPKSVQGRDLSGVFAGRAAAGRASLIAGYMPFARQAYDYPEWRGVRSATHTYVETLQGPLHLFDNRQDPFQTTDLINRPALAGLQAGLARQLRSLLAQTGDRLEPREAYWKRYNLDIGDFGQVRYTTASPRAPGG